MYRGFVIAYVSHDRKVESIFFFFSGLVSEKQSDDIFTIDKQPDAVEPDVLLRQKRPRRPKVDQDNLRCFQNLKGLPGANVPVKT